MSSPAIFSSFKPTLCFRFRYNLQRHVSTIISGISSPSPERHASRNFVPPFYFETGYALFAKRPSRPFPPPFSSRPSSSFSDALTTHTANKDRRTFVNGQQIRGLTNGDDAVIVEENLIGANDGVGAWTTRPRGHAALWSRLILHFWALEIEKDLSSRLSECSSSEPDPVGDLEKAYELTKLATKNWLGTTTACAALLYYDTHKGNPEAVLYVTNLGDSQILVIRPPDPQLIYKTKEQWHWFDCPRQLGTNSPDTPRQNAVMDRIVLRENDVVLAVSDGVVDNLWAHEIVQNVVDSIRKWETGQGFGATGDRAGGAGGGMQFVAHQLVSAAKAIAEDPFAESPFMEKAVEEGLALEGGKLDDISVVAGLCRKRPG